MEGNHRRLRLSSRGCSRWQQSLLRARGSLTWPWHVRLHPGSWSSDWGAGSRSHVRPLVVRPRAWPAWLCIQYHAKNFVHLWRGRRDRLYPAIPANFDCPCTSARRQWFWIFCWQPARHAIHSTWIRAQQHWSCSSSWWRPAAGVYLLPTPTRHQRTPSQSPRTHRQTSQPRSTTRRPGVGPRSRLFFQNYLKPPNFYSCSGLILFKMQWSTFVDTKC